MIPLRDDIPSKTTPFVNYLLICANVAIFAHELALGRHLQGFLTEWGLVPLRYASTALAHKVGWAQWLAPWVTCMFLHGGWMHLISNMWCLWIFGDNVEDALGHGKFLAFYLLCGLAGGSAQVWASWGSPYPTIGASGAIAGVMGAYMILFPHARVLALVPIFFFLRMMEIPATIFLGLWIWSQMYSGALGLANAGLRGGVAFWAHIGGFLGGIVLLGPFLGGAPKRRRS